jgi:Tfp pilus assembly protein PilX
MSRLANRIMRRGRAEDGWVVITAIVLATIMLGVGLAVLATADTQTGQSRQERVRESSFNLAEGLLQSEAVVLQHNWPTTPPCTGNALTCGYQWSSTDPAACTQVTAVTNTKQCPTPAALVGSNGAFSNVDQSLGSTSWKIQVRDDVGVCLTNAPPGYPLAGTAPFYDSCQIPTYYTGQCPPPNGTDATKCWPTISTAKYSTDPSKAPGNDQKLCKDSSNVSVPCTWDANDNKQLWVRVDATVAGKTRSLVALLHLENFPVNLNSTDAVNGGAVNFTNSGNKNVVDAGTSQIVARCLPTSGTFPDSGNLYSTSIVSVVAPNKVSIPNTVATGASGFRDDMIVALGVGKPSVYELLRISSIDTSVNPYVVTFTTNMVRSHATGDKLELEPAPGNASIPNNCESWGSPNGPGENGADKHQLDPPANYKSDPNYPPFLDTGAYAGVTSGLTPLNGCPTDWNGNIYIKTAPVGGCTMPTGTYNSPSDEHIIIVEGQAPSPPNTCAATPALTISANTVFYGLIYMRNTQGCTYNQPIVNIHAGAQIQGGIAVDGHGQVQIGQASNSNNCPVQGGSLGNITCPTVKFDPVAFGSVAATGAAGLVQNTWRELAPNQINPNQ